MDLFARCFLLVFAQLYVGGLLALSIPPFHEITRGFYKSTAGVYLGFGVAALVGRLALLTRPPEHAAAASWWDAMEIVVWILSLGAASVYLSTLWGDPYARRARAYAVAWMAGITALALGAQTFRVAAPLSFETVFYPISLVISALVLGAVTTGMLLGHWYLIDQDLSIDPFRRMLSFFVVLLGLQAGWFMISSGLLALLGGEATVDRLRLLADEHLALLVVRLILSPMSAAGLGWMIWRTLQIPQTMAATGLFYIAILAVLVGEMMGRFILFRTALPL
jgi:hypothetical protein